VHCFCICVAVKHCLFEDLIEVTRFMERDFCLSYLVLGFFLSVFIVQHRLLLGISYCVKFLVLEFPLSCAQPIGKPIVTMESVHSQKVPFGNPPDINNPAEGNPNPKKIGFRKLISSILSDVERFAEFNGETVFLKSEQKWRIYCQKTRCMANSNMTSIFVKPDSTKLLLQHWSCQIDACRQYSSLVQFIV